MNINTPSIDTYFTNVSKKEIKSIKYQGIDVLDLLEDVAHEWLEDLSETLEEYSKDKV